MTDRPDTDRDTPAAWDDFDPPDSTQDWPTNFRPAMTAAANAAECSSDLYVTRRLSAIDWHPSDPRFAAFGAYGLKRHASDGHAGFVAHNLADLKRVQDKLNSRPRPTLDLDTPAQRIAALISQAA